MASIGPFIAINDQAKWPNLTNSAFSKAKTSVTPQTNTGHLLNPKKRKKKKQRKTSLGPQSMEEENKLIVCRTVGRPLIFPNVIEGVYTHFENRGRREKKGGLERGGWKNKKKERKKGKGKNEKSSTMQLGWRGWVDDTRVPGVFYWPVSVGWKFRIMYEMFAWTLFNPLALHTLSILCASFSLGPTPPLSPFPTIY